ncbi:uncharacterized protein TEOVI_000699800 [Trypanosoma equiperdum]|uniref:Uncharacterized protein n=2 Tax=Trypanozoon TaxID=39700 RepID=Q57ZW7_TRYB2|nr:hypothetical protein, conserved [Trypanosoma brucei brucei TREU927]AAX79358.1 hypothetical protein, conserved [Trypanosoma brucei]AAZ11404.1 hypothetical protein, conserved [Trypanosoma brucei brucei TREU927]SCU65076.1 hypothetical protein, conserved [Trypanosoma equiperdum]
MLVERSYKTSFQYGREGVEDATIACTICPSMEKIHIRFPRSVDEIKRSISTYVAVNEECINLYVRGCGCFTEVSDESPIVGEYYVLLRLRAGKGGFRKQLEKKGRAFARSKKLRSSTRQQQGGRSDKNRAQPIKLSKPHSDDKGVGRREQGNTVASAVDISIRDAVCCGVKRLVEGLST